MSADNLSVSHLVEHEHVEVLSAQRCTFQEDESSITLKWDISRPRGSLIHRGMGRANSYTPH